MPKLKLKILIVIIMLKTELQGSLKMLKERLTKWTAVLLTFWSIVFTMSLSHVANTYYGSPQHQDAELELIGMYEDLKGFKDEHDAWNI